MNVSGAVGPAAHQPARAQVKPPAPSAAKDADGDRDGTKPGKIDVRDVIKPANRVDVRA
jgi:hypothetical protein